MSKIFGDSLYKLLYKDSGRAANPNDSNPSWYSLSSDKQSEYREQFINDAKALGGNIVTISFAPVID